MTEQVVIKIGADATRALLAFQNVGKAALAMRASLIGAGVMVAAKAIQIATSIPRGIMEAINRADKVFTSSQISGLSAEEFSALEYAASQSEVTIQDLETASRYLARTHNAALIPALLQTAEEFENLDDEVEKIRIASERFGPKSGSGLIAFLNQGKKSVKELLEEAGKIGVVIDADFAKAADAFNDSWKKMTASMDAFYQSLAVNILPALQSIIFGINGMAQAARDFFKGLGPAGEFAALLKDTAKYFLAIAESVGRLFHDIETKPIDENAPMFSPFRHMSSILGTLNEKFKYAAEPMAKVLRDRLGAEAARTDDIPMDGGDSSNAKINFSAKAKEVKITIPESRASSAFTSRGFLSQGEAQMVSRTASFQKNVQSTLAEILGLQRQYLPKMAESLS